MPHWAGFALGFTLGLVLFFLGLLWLNQSLRFLAGQRAQAVLTRFTATPARAFVAGTLLTAVLQSSGAVTATTVALVDAGLLDLAAATAVILGANVGTTLTVQLFALRPGNLVWVLLAIGAVGLPLRRRWAAVPAALGLLFLGLEGMERSLAPLALSPALESLVAAAGSPLAAVGLGAAGSALLQSGSVLIAIVLTLARQGAVTLPAAVGLTLGSNVGTCVTALLAATQSGRAGRLAAYTHLLFNLAGVLAALLVYPWFLAVVGLTSQDPGRQIANAQTLFNVATALAALPLARPWARLWEERPAR